MIVELADTLLLLSAAAVNALTGLSKGWSVPPGVLNWGVGDPCGVPWDGVTCASDNVTVTILYVAALSLHSRSYFPSVHVSRRSAGDHFLGLSLIVTGIIDK